MKRKFDEIYKDDNEIENVYDEVDLDKINDYLKKWFIDKNIIIINK